MTNQIKLYINYLLDDAKQNPIFYVWIMILMTIIGMALYTVALSLIYSLEIYEFSHHIIWVMMVSNYVFLVVSSTGLCIVSSLGHVFGIERYEMIAKRGVFLALITIIFGLMSIGAHLGHPERAMIFMPLTPNPRSAMWWMAVLYNLYVVFIVVECWLLFRSDLLKRVEQAEGLKRTILSLLSLQRLNNMRYGALLDDPRLLRLIGASALISGLSAHNTLGAVFGHVEARPLWYGAYYPIYFLLSASYSGFAWLLAISIATYKLKGESISEDYRSLIFEMAQILALLLSVGLLFTVYKMGFGLFEPAKVKPIMLFLKGPFSLGFWLFEIAIGTVLPILILLYATNKRKITGVLVASVLVLVGVFVMRYDFIVASQVYPVIHSQHLLSSHLPTFMEVILIGGILGALFLSYTMGVKFLPLKEKEYKSEK
jgi:molybdopterin-containing oxidoreductase family membrane subunit